MIDAHHPRVRISTRAAALVLVVLGASEASGCGSSATRDQPPEESPLGCVDDGDCGAGSFCSLRIQGCDSNVDGVTRSYAEGECHLDCDPAACGACESDYDCGRQQQCTAAGACEATDPGSCPTPVCPDRCPLTAVTHGCPVCLCNALDCDCNSCP